SKLELDPVPILVKLPLLDTGFPVVCRDRHFNNRHQRDDESAPESYKTRNVESFPLQQMASYGRNGNPAKSSQSHVFRNDSVSSANLHLGDDTQRHSSSLGARSPRKLGLIASLRMVLNVHIQRYKRPAGPPFPRSGKDRAAEDGRKKSIFFGSPESCTPQKEAIDVKSATDSLPNKAKNGIGTSQWLHVASTMDLENMKGWDHMCYTYGIDLHLYMYPLA